MRGHMRKRNKDQGYTLIEMIIVIAIIAVVAGMALISVTLIHSARAKEASTTVDSQVATLITQSKNMQSDRAGWVYAARIYADDKGAYYFQRGYYKAKDGDTPAQYDFNNTDKEGDGKGTSLSSYVVIRYNGQETIVQDGFKEDTFGIQGAQPSDEDGHLVKDLNFGQGLFLRFDKDGTCAEGVGDIRFYKRNGNIVAHEYIRANGSHQTR